MKCSQHFYLGGAFFGVTDLKAYFRPAFLQMKSLAAIYIYKGAYKYMYRQVAGQEYAIHNRIHLFVSVTY